MYCVLYGLRISRYRLCKQLIIELICLYKLSSCVCKFNIIVQLTTLISKFTWFVSTILINYNFPNKYNKPYKLYTIKTIIYVSIGKLFITILVLKIIE